MEYIDSISKIKSEQLQGFFVGWKSPLTPERHFQLLQGSTHFIVAIEDNKAVGFITALTDGVTSSFIPLLEVYRIIKIVVSAQNYFGLCSLNWKASRMWT